MLITTRESVASRCTRDAGKDVIGPPTLEANVSSQTDTMRGATLVKGRRVADTGARARRRCTADGGRERARGAARSGRRAAGPSARSYPFGLTVTPANGR